MGEKPQISGEGGMLRGLNIVFLSANILLERATPRALTVACNIAARARKREIPCVVAALGDFDVDVEDLNSCKYIWLIIAVL